MRVVLLDDIHNLGEAGAVVEVKNGYARNFLIPRKLAELATADAVNRVGLIQRAAEAKRAKRRSEAAGKFQQLAGQSITLAVKAGTAGRIFGSVTSATIAAEVQRQLGVTLERRHIMLDEPLRHLGEFTVPLRAAADVTGELRVVIEPEGPQGRTRQYGRPAAPEATATAAEAASADEADQESAQQAGAEGAEPESADSSSAAKAPAEPYEDLESQVAG